MDYNIESLMPGGLNVGVGVSYKISPFKKLIEIDYYDGVIEGFAEIDTKELIVYFKKIWWDDLQDLRLFTAHFMPKSEIDNFDIKSYDFLKSAIDKLPIKLKPFYFFSKNLNGEIFVVFSNSDEK